ncbi:hypothetical protein FRB96_002695 [Tulasnella sp. 330]|nr:hypothetical protein FRB96_002695 [Tulasnella sp. 330]KAG8884386.1 hypothetical protein FRB97_004395 [Tulasnella sp. 331]KAG8888056.1 hypothetical protein FRB98_008520 [Tulasnella sp. 332]
MLLPVFAIALVCAPILYARPATDTKASPVTIKHDNPLIFYHGRWTDEPSSWWASTGFKLYVENLDSLSLNLGEATTTSPAALIGLSVDYAPFISVNVSAGVNVLPIAGATTRKTSVIEIATEGWQNNRIQVDSLVLNPGAVLLPYAPSRLHFQFIGDSLTAGQYDDQGEIDSWAFLTGEAFKAEHNINAQPGGCLTDQVCWGNEHGVSYQYFRTEDTGYYYTTDHNYTTPWDFKKDLTPTHLWILIGANDNAYNISPTAFEETYLSFVTRLRELYPIQPLFILNPWGWPAADGTTSYYYPGVYQDVVAKRNAAGDKHVYLIDTVGWVDFDDLFPANQHPTPEGHQKIAEQMVTWLENWGLQPLANWGTVPL